LTQRISDSLGLANIVRTSLALGKRTFSIAMWKITCCPDICERRVCLVLDFSVSTIHVRSTTFKRWARAVQVT
jgi:hypothetical protein